MKKILIVDDDAALRSAMKMVLSKQYQVLEAGSKKEGTALLNQMVPDLVLLDVMMETSSAGFEMAREMRQNSRFAKTKILMATNVDKDMKMDFRSAAKDPDWLPVDDYVVKPLDPKILLAKIEQLIGK
jgi:DNA-binding response OmpR family regulator